MSCPLESSFARSLRPRGMMTKKEERQLSNVPIREKVQRITEAAKDGESYSESSKNAGMVIIYAIFALAVLFTLAVAIGFTQTGQYIGSAVCLLISGGLGFVLLKLIRT